MSQCETLQPEGQALPDVASISEPSPLDQLLHQGARQMLMTTVEAEVAAYIEAHQHEVDEQGRRLVVRNGRAQERTLVSGVGPIKIRAPRVNDRRVDEQGRKFRFTSEILPPYLRRTESVRGTDPTNRRSVARSDRASTRPRSHAAKLLSSAPPWWPTSPARRGPARLRALPWAVRFAERDEGG